MFSSPHLGVRLQVMQLSREGVDVTKMLEEPQRRALFRREVEKRVSDGKGELHQACCNGTRASINRTRFLMMYCSCAWVKTP